MRSVVKLISFIIPSLIVTWYSFLTIFSSELDFKEFLVQAIGGGVGAYRAFILVLGVALFILLVYMGKRTISGEPKKIHLRFFYSLSILGFLSFAILGGEFSAPKYTFAPFLNFKENFSSERVVRRSDVEFKLEECQRRGNKITCSISVYNFGNDDLLKSASNSYVVDDQNNKSKVYEIIVGSQSYGNMYTERVSLPEGTNADMTISFEDNSFDSSKLVRALYIYVKLDNKRQTIVYRNISLN